VRTLSFPDDARPKFPREIFSVRSQTIFERRRRMTLKAKTGVSLMTAAAFTMLAAATASNAQPPASADPTCSDTLGIVVHGQHVVGDYVTGTGSGDLDWPPSGGDIGATVSDNGGAAIPGGPGPGFHFPNGFAPGASFCNDSQSPGTHL
jgi:hypothetical protein